MSSRLTPAASGAWWAQIVGGWDNKDENGEEIRNVISRLLYSKADGIGMNIYGYNICPQIYPYLVIR